MIFKSRKKSYGHQYHYRCVYLTKSHSAFLKQITLFKRKKNGFYLVRISRSDCNTLWIFLVWNEAKLINSWHWFTTPSMATLYTVDRSFIVFIVLSSGFVCILSNSLSDLFSILLCLSTNSWLKLSSLSLCWSTRSMLTSSFFSAATVSSSSSESCWQFRLATTAVFPPEFELLYCLALFLANSRR